MESKFDVLAYAADLVSGGNRRVFDSGEGWVVISTKYFDELSELNEQVDILKKELAAKSGLGDKRKEAESTNLQEQIFNTLVATNKHMTEVNANLAELQDAVKRDVDRRRSGCYGRSTK